MADLEPHLSAFFAKRPSAVKALADAMKTDPALRSAVTERIQATEGVRPERCWITRQTREFLTTALKE